MSIEPPMDPPDEEEYTGDGPYDDEEWLEQQRKDSEEEHDFYEWLEQRNWQNMRQLLLDFIADPMDEEDEAAWERHLNTYDELLAEVKRLREELEQCWEYISHIENHDMQNLADDSYRKERDRLRGKLNERSNL